MCKGSFITQLYPVSNPAETHTQECDTLLQECGAAIYTLQTEKLGLQSVAVHIHHSIKSTGKQRKRMQPN